MSRIANVIFIVDAFDSEGVSDVASWMASDPAASSDDRSSGSVGPLMALTGTSGQELWGGYKSLSFSVWGAVTDHLHWGRFLDKVVHTKWKNPERLQLMMQSDGDPYFRLYMWRGGGLVNVAPPPDGYQWEPPY